MDTNDYTDGLEHAGVGLGDGTTDPDTTEGESATKYKVDDAIGKQNICDLLPQAELDKIGAEGLADFKNDDNDFQPRRNKIEQIYNLLLQVAEIKNYPFQGAANVKYPLLTKACMQFAAIAYPAIFRDGKVAKMNVLGNDDGDEPLKDPNTGAVMTNPDTNAPIRPNEGYKARKGERVSKVLNYQLSEEMENWTSDTDRIMFTMSGTGFAYRKYFYDPLERKVCSRVILPQFLIVNIDAPSVEGASRVSEEFELYPWQIEEYIRNDIFQKFDYSVSSETMGINQPVNTGGHSADREEPHIFIEQYRRIDLDGDGYAEPYIVTIHKQSGKVCRIIARFSADDVELEIGLDGAYKIARIKAQDCIVKYPFLPSPEGSFYDIGYGDLLLPINEAMNSSINQLFDAAHLYNLGGGFIGQGLRIKSGANRFQPGEFKVVNTTGGKIRDNVFPLPVPQPSPVLMELIGYLGKAGEDIASLSRLIAGEMPTNMPATTTMAAVEQSMTPFKSIFKRIHQTLKKELKIICYLNKQFLDPARYKKILDVDVTQEDFALDDIDIIPVSDPDIVSNMQRLAKAQILMELKDDPFINPIEARKETLKASGYADVERFIIMPPPPSPQPAEIAAQAQAEMFQAQTAKTRKETQLLDLEAALNIEEKMADIQLKIANAIKALAQAEAAEEGTQIETYKLQLAEMEQRMVAYGNFFNRASQLAQAPVQ